MSTFTIRVTKKNTKSRTPFCAICKKAGKSPSVFNSHFVRDKPGHNGKIVCPTLLSTECRYCHALGHTTKFCPKLEEKANKQRQHGRVQEMSNRHRWAKETLRRKVQLQQKSSLSVEQPLSKATGAFAVLSYDDDVAVIPSSHIMDHEMATATALPPIGAWATGSAAKFIKNRPAPIKVTALVKAPTIALAPLKRIAPPIPSRPAPAIPMQECSDIEKELIAIADAKKPLVLAPLKRKKRIDSWADAADDEDSDNEDDTLDERGRPATDNSSW